MPRVNLWCCSRAKQADRYMPADPKQVDIVQDDKKGYPTVDLRNTDEQTDVGGQHHNCGNNYNTLPGKQQTDVSVHEMTYLDPGYAQGGNKAISEQYLGAEKDPDQSLDENQYAELPENAYDMNSEEGVYSDYNTTNEHDYHSVDGSPDDTKTYKNLFPHHYERTTGVISANLTTDISVKTTCCTCTPPNAVTSSQQEARPRHVPDTRGYRPGHIRQILPVPPPEGIKPRIWEDNAEKIQSPTIPSLEITRSHSNILSQSDILSQSELLSLHSERYGDEYIVDVEQGGLYKNLLLDITIYIPAGVGNRGILLSKYTERNLPDHLSDYTIISQAYRLAENSDDSRHINSKEMLVKFRHWGKPAWRSDRFQYIRRSVLVRSEHGEWMLADTSGFESVTTDFDDKFVSLFVCHLGHFMAVETLVPKQFVIASVYLRPFQDTLSVIVTLTPDGDSQSVYGKRVAHTDMCVVRDIPMVTVDVSLANWSYANETHVTDIETEYLFHGRSPTPAVVTLCRCPQPNAPQSNMLVKLKHVDRDKIIMVTKENFEEQGISQSRPPLFNQDMDDMLNMKTNTKKRGALPGKVSDDVDAFSGKVSDVVDAHPGKKSNDVGLGARPKSRGLNVNPVIPDRGIEQPQKTFVPSRIPYDVPEAHKSYVFPSIPANRPGAKSQQLELLEVPISKTNVAVTKPRVYENEQKISANNPVIAKTEKLTNSQVSSIGPLMSYEKEMKLAALFTRYDRQIDWIPIGKKLFPNRGTPWGKLDPSNPKFFSRILMIYSSNGGRLPQLINCFRDANMHDVVSILEED